MNQTRPYHGCYCCGACMCCTWFERGQVQLSESVLFAFWLQIFAILWSTECYIHFLLLAAKGVSCCTYFWSHNPFSTIQSLSKIGSITLPQYCRYKTSNPSLPCQKKGTPEYTSRIAPAAWISSATYQSTLFLDIRGKKTYSSCLVGFYIRPQGYQRQDMMLAK